MSLINVIMCSWFLMKKIKQRKYSAKYSYRLGWYGKDYTANNLQFTIRLRFIPKLDDIAT